MKKRPMMIAIAGASGSGKTTVAKYTTSQLSEIEVELYSEPPGLVFPMDNYYKDRSHLEPEERVGINYDHPDAFEWDLLREHLYDLKEGKSIERPRYSFVEHTRENETDTIEPADVIIFEGILALYDEDIRELLDYAFFIDTSLDECLARRMLRDIEERGRTPESVVEQWRETVRPGYHEFVLPTRKYADFIIEWDGETEKSLEGILAIVKDYLD